MSRPLTPAERRVRQVGKYKGTVWFYAGRREFTFYHQGDDGHVVQFAVPTKQLLAALEAIEADKGRGG